MKQNENFIMKKGYFNILFDYWKSYWYISILVFLLVLIALYRGSYKLAGLNLSGILFIFLSLYYLVGNVFNLDYFLKLPRMQIARINNNEKANKIIFLIISSIVLILGVLFTFGIYCSKFSGHSIC